MTNQNRFNILAYIRKDSLLRPGQEYRYKFIYVMQAPKMQLTEDNLKYPFRFRYIGMKPYHGFDDNGGREILAKELDLINVSRGKAQQLINDFPDLFVFIDALTGEKIFDDKKGG